MNHLKIKVRGHHISAAIVRNVCSQIKETPYTTCYEKLYHQTDHVILWWYLLQQHQ